MLITHRRLSPSRSLTWLIWLALLLPLAQSAAAWHGYAHAAVQASDGDDATALPPTTACDLCLHAATAGGAAMPSWPGPLPFTAVAQTVSQPAADHIWWSLPALCYRSRAPPVLPR